MCSHVAHARQILRKVLVGPVWCSLDDDEDPVDLKPLMVGLKELLRCLASHARLTWNQIGRWLETARELRSGWLYASGSNAPVSESPRIVELVVNKDRGPGPVTVARDHEKLTTLKGGKAGEPCYAPARPRRP